MNGWATLCCSFLPYRVDIDFYLPPTSSSFYSSSPLLHLTSLSFSSPLYLFLASGYFSIIRHIFYPSFSSHPLPYSPQSTELDFSLITESTVLLGYSLDLSSLANYSLLFVLLRYLYYDAALFHHDFDLARCTFGEVHRLCGGEYPFPETLHQLHGWSL